MANVVLAHGILGFDKIGLKGFTLANYFNGVSAALKQNNHKVFVPEVNPVGSIENRAEELSKQILGYCNRENIPKKSLIILAHSMGGLDARKALADNNNLVEYTKALVTIGTPHKGSPIADLLTKDLFITKLLYGNFLKLLGDSVGGLVDLTQERCILFDKNTPSTNSVKYYSISGTNRELSSSLFFKGLGGLIDKENDGVVTRESAEKNDGIWNYIDNWPADHAGLIGWFDHDFQNTYSDDHIARYIELIKDLEN